MPNEVCASSPGRVCFMGEYLDNHMYPVIACSITSLRVYVLVQRTTNHVTQVTSHAPFNSFASFDIHAPIRFTSGPLDHVRAVCKVLREAGHQLENVELTIKSTLPSGAGLSSSAALCVATTAALNSAFDLGLTTERICSIAHRAESKALATGCGQMDQFTSGVGGLLYIDCSTEPPASVSHLHQRDDVAIVIGCSMLPRSLRDALTGVKQRFAQHESLIQDFIRLTLLRIGDLRSALSQPDWDPSQVGALLNTSHGYLRDYAQVSNDIIERYIHSALRAGAWGAKLTGATGTGGSMFALVDRERVPAVVEALAHAGAHTEVVRMAADGCVLCDVEEFQAL